MNRTKINVPSLVLCELPDPGRKDLESYSPFCLKVHRALRVAALPYTRRHGAHPGAFKRLNPAGQVPVLLVDDEPVADSTAILHRIEALAPGSMSGGGTPSSTAEAWLWEELADASLSGFLVAARWADDRNWPLVKMAYFGAMPAIVRAIVPSRIRKHVIGSLVARDVLRAGPARCWARFEDLLDRLDARAPKEGYWVGRSISAADVSIFAQLHSLRNDLTAWQCEQIERRASLSAYLDRVDERTSAGAPAAVATAA